MRRGPLYGYIQIQIVWRVTGGLSLQRKNTVIELKLDDDRDEYVGVSRCRPG